jgi:FMN-dependent NADH-azoreductase
LRLDALRLNNEKLAHVAEEMIATTPETNTGQLIAFIDALVTANNVFEYAEQLEQIANNKKRKSTSSEIK